MAFLVDGVLHVHASDNLIVGPSGRIAVEHRVMNVFSVLLNNPGAVIGRSDLMELVWKDVCVSDDSLTKAVSELRRALNDAGASRPIIATVPKRGYRLDGVVTLTDMPSRPNHHPVPVRDRRRSPFLAAGVLAVMVLFTFSGATPNVMVRTLEGNVPEGVLLPVTEYVSGSSRIKLMGVVCDNNRTHTVQEFREAFREERLPEGCSKSY